VVSILSEKLIICHHINTLVADRIYKRTSFALLRERIHHKRKELDATSRDLLVIHLHLASTVSEPDWNLIDYLTSDKAACTGETKRSKQCQKFIRLQKTQHSGPEFRGETVVKLSNKPLDDSLHCALQKGLNFAISPTTLPIKDIITGVEKAVHSLPVETDEEIRQETES
jgi:hypothetical protein